MSDINYEIRKEIGVISESSRGWTKELNLVSWNGAAPKYDIRDWAPDHAKMGKGITLTEDEARKLKEMLVNAFGKDMEELAGAFDFDEADYIGEEVALIIGEEEYQGEMRDRVLDVKDASVADDGPSLL